MNKETFYDFSDNKQANNFPKVNESLLKFWEDFVMDFNVSLYEMLYLWPLHVFRCFLCV